MAMSIRNQMHPVWRRVRLCVLAFYIIAAVATFHGMHKYQTRPPHSFYSDALLAEVGFAPWGDLWCAAKFQREGYGVDFHTIQYAVSLVEDYKEKKRYLEGNGVVGHKEGEFYEEMSNVLWESEKEVRLDRHDESAHRWVD